MESDSPKSCSACGSWWRLPLLLGLVLAAILLARGRGFWDDAPKTTGGANGESLNVSASEKVSLTVDFGNGRRQQFDGLTWKDGMTVADLFGNAAGLGVTQKGSGPGAFLTAIDDVSNEGTDGRNWTYEVNGQSGDRSFAMYELRPEDRVLWTFGSRR